ncbi:hypothetical protein KUTeg_001453 [Tegillarca granosa]|uniref:RING-type E3 ubiquitin transferase n=1 Tax=Tegillarca granosa TaxID=220873 RepID=A0ABQ9FRG9_TEGGR|nr:hypothetical protein KUTeg_001453 [Tegillarca granosa]
MVVVKPGMRVVRGPDWNSKKQDNGEGFLGTIIYVPKKGSSDNKVTVIWDSGRELRYRAGHDGKCDLRVFDAAPAGIIHKNIVCDSCGDDPIKGMRWKCCNCKDYNLCTPCYMQNKHDLSHGFVRMDMDQSVAYPVPPRSKATKMATAKGVFPNAEVMRGPHWKYKNEDGGEGEVGKVIKLVTWNNNSYRGGVQVKWKSMSDIKTFRLGGEGCVDVIYTRVTEDASGGNYYPEHLPRVDVVSPGAVPLKPGDKVTVNLSLQHLKTLQDNEMYGGWDEEMKQVIGKLGRIIKKDQDGDLRVKIEGNSWIFSPVCCQVVDDPKLADKIPQLTSSDEEDSDGSMDGSVGTGMNAVAESIAQLFVDMLRGTPGVDQGKENIVQAAANGELAVVKAVLKSYPDKVDQEVEGKSALQIACYYGHKDIVDFLLENKADVNKTDSEGDTPVHYATFGKENAILEILLKMGAKKDVKNKKGQAAIHIAVGTASVECTQVLVNHGCDVSIQVL